MSLCCPSSLILLDPSAFHTFRSPDPLRCDPVLYCALHLVSAVWLLSLSLSRDGDALDYFTDLYLVRLSSQFLALVFHNWFIQPYSSGRAFIVPFCSSASVAWDIHPNGHLHHSRTSHKRLSTLACPRQRSSLINHAHSWWFDPKFHTVDRYGESDVSENFIRDTDASWVSLPCRIRMLLSPSTWFSLRYQAVLVSIFFSLQNEISTWVWR